MLTLYGHLPVGAHTHTPVMRSDVTWIIRNNELGGQVAPNQQPLAPVSTDLENFALTGAENVPNAPLFVPYQVCIVLMWGFRPVDTTDSSAASGAGHCIRIRYQIDVGVPSRVSLTCL